MNSAFRTKATGRSKILKEKRDAQNGTKRASRPPGKKPRKVRLWCCTAPKKPIKENLEEHAGVFRDPEKKSEAKAVPLRKSGVVQEDT